MARLFVGLLLFSDLMIYDLRVSCACPILDLKIIYMFIFIKSALYINLLAYLFIHFYNLSSISIAARCSSC